MKTVYFTTPYIEAAYDEASLILYITGTDQLGDLDELGYKMLLEEMISKLSSIAQINGVLNDATKSTFPITPAMQNWVMSIYSNFYIPRGVTKFALVLPVDFIAGLSYEQTAEEAENIARKRKIEIRHFSSAFIAESWLLA